MRIDQKRKVKIDGCQKQISRMMDAQKRIKRDANKNSPRTARTKCKRLGYNRRCRSFELWYQNDTGWESTKAKVRPEVQELGLDRSDRRLRAARRMRWRGEWPIWFLKQKSIIFMSFFMDLKWTERKLNDELRTEANMTFYGFLNWMEI